MSNIITNDNTPWACLKHPEEMIFYWVHSKCANSYYKRILISMDWKTTTVKEIDWQHSLVFSHIRDPLEKHRTGLIEYFFYNDCVDILERNYDDEDFWLMLSRSAWLDCHSMSVWEHLGELSEHIHWIPIDLDSRDHLSETLDFIGFHGDRDFFRKIPKINVSAGFKKNCVDQLKMIKPDPMIIKYLERDRVIYDRASKKSGFEPETYKKRLQQMLDLGLSQQESEKILDREVEDGSYLKWTDTNIVFSLKSKDTPTDTPK